MHCREEGAKLESRTLNLLVNLGPNPHIWSRAQGNDQKNEIAGLSVDVSGLSLRDRLRSSDIQREFKVESLLLGLERSQMRCSRHLTRMSPGRLSVEVFWADQTGKKSWGKPRICLRYNISPLDREHPKIPQEELENVAGDSCLGGLDWADTPATGPQISAR